MIDVNADWARMVTVQLAAEEGCQYETSISGVLKHFEKSLVRLVLITAISSMGGGVWGGGCSTGVCAKLLPLWA